MWLSTMDFTHHHYHFIIEKIKQFAGEFNCYGKNTEKHKIFSVPITEKLKRINKNVKINCKKHNLQISIY